MSLSLRRLAVAGLGVAMVGAGVIAAAPLAGAAPAAPASFDPAAGPAAGTLTNGVTYTVSPVGGVTAGGSQTVTLSPAAAVTFTVSGMNCAGEGIRVPSGATVVGALAPGLSFNSATDVVSGNGTAGNGTATFALPGTTSSFTITGVGAPGCVRIDQEVDVTSESVPTETVNAPVNGATYFQGQSVTADYTCDSDPGTISSCTGTVADGAAVDTSTTGPQTFSVTGTNGDGVSSTTNVTYNVVAPQSSCYAQGLRMKGYPGEHPFYGANVDTPNPCATDSYSLLNPTLTLVQGIPLLKIPSTALSLGVDSGATTYTASGLPTSTAIADLADVTLTAPGLTIAIEGVHSQASSTLNSCSSATTLGTSSIASLRINGKKYDVDNKPLTINVLGLVKLSLNQQVVTGNTITQRALYLEFPASNQLSKFDTSLGEASAGVSC